MSLDNPVGYAKPGCWSFISLLVMVFIEFSDGHADVTWENEWPQMPDNLVMMFKDLMSFSFRSVFMISHNINSCNSSNNLSNNIICPIIPCCLYCHDTTIFRHCHIYPIILPAAQFMTSRYQCDSMDDGKKFSCRFRTISLFLLFPSACSILHVEISEFRSFPQEFFEETISIITIGK